jgi:hypothetical protein
MPRRLSFVSKKDARDTRRMALGTEYQHRAADRNMREVRTHEDLFGGRPDVLRCDEKNVRDFYEPDIRGSRSAPPAGNGQRRISAMRSASAVLVPATPSTSRLFAVWNLVTAALVADP